MPSRVVASSGFLWYSMSVSRTMKVFTKEIDMNKNFDATLFRQAKRELSGLVLVVSVIMFVSGFLSNVVLSFTAIKSAGYSFMDYMMTSDFGFVVLSWNYNSTWLIISLALFIGGFLGVVASFGGELR